MRRQMQLTVGYVKRTSRACPVDRVATQQTQFLSLLTLLRPLLPYGYSYKASCARPGSADICNFLTSEHSGLSARVPGCQKLQTTA